MPDTGIKPAGEPDPADQPVPMPDPDINPAIYSVLRLAISDPGSVTPRRNRDTDHPEYVAHWSARAAAEAIRPFLAKPADERADRLTGAGEQRERLLADWSPHEHAIIVSNSVTGQSVRFGEKAWDAFLASRHHPDSDCNCEPGGDPEREGRGACEYRLLADAADKAFRPPGDDIAEVAIRIGAIERAAAFISDQACGCTPEMIEDGRSCTRCAALGQLGGKPVPR